MASTTRSARAAIAKRWLDRNHERARRPLPLGRGPLGYTRAAVEGLRRVTLQRCAEASSAFWVAVA